MAVAVGLLPDAAWRPEVMEATSVVVERLRERLGIDSGRALGDQEAAARRIQGALPDRLFFSEAEVRAKANALGHDLTEVRCGSSCGSVPELAGLEPRRNALRAFPEGRQGPAQRGSEESVRASEAGIPPNPDEPEDAAREVQAPPVRKAG